MPYDPRNLPDGEEELYSPAEVAAMFRVGSTQVARWARLGLLTSLRTPGGHHRFKASEVRALLTRENRP